MTHAEDINEVAPGIFVWQAYDPSVKAELYSTALETPSGTYIVDPISLYPENLLRLLERRKIAGIFVTNTNHVRAAAEFAQTFSVPIYIHDALSGNADLPSTIGVREGEPIGEGLIGIAIDGGPPGEMALLQDAGTMVLGDALIHFEPRGLELLPTKYCLDAKLMRQSLKKLLDHDFERLLFAHGFPILSNARARVQQLLANN